MKIKTSFIYPILSGLLVILPAAAFAGGAQNSNSAVARQPQLDRIA